MKELDEKNDVVTTAVATPSIEELQREVSDLQKEIEKKKLEAEQYHRWWTEADRKVEKMKEEAILIQKFTKALMDQWK